MEKVFSSFRNIYIFDLQDTVKKITADEPGNDVYIYGKDEKRITSNTNISNKHLKAFYPDRYSNLADLYISNGAFQKNLFLIRQNDYTLSSNGQVRPFFSSKNGPEYLKIGHHLSNKKHTNYVSAYKVFPYPPSPDIDINLTYNNAILKTYIPEYETYIYQVQNKLIWLIGLEIGNQTEIIYQIYPDQPNLLSESRILYGFDNWGFFINDESEKERMGKYRVFEKKIPSKYLISFIVVGFNNGTSDIRRSFVLSI